MIYEKYYHPIHNALHSMIFKKVCRLSKKYFDDNSVILDLGCGSCKYSKIFSKKNYIGLDIDPRSTNNELNIVKANGEMIPFKKESVDGIISVEVIEHLDSPKNFLYEIDQVLKKNSFAIIVFPNDFNHRLSRIFSLNFPARFPGHKQSIKPDFIKNNLENLEIVYESSIPSHLPFIFSLNWVIVFRKRS